MYFDRLSLPQKKQITGLLELICRELELTEAQYKDAERKYLAVGEYLQQGGIIKVFKPDIFPQGSMKLGTTVRPIGREEFDIDLVCKLILANSQNDQKFIRDLIRNRLKEDKVYSEMLEPLNRGWRLNYAKSSKFHLDITPAVINERSSNKGLLVPDKELKEWKPSNPEGYVEWFEGFARIEPMSLLKERGLFLAKVNPLPEQTPFKSILKRCVQLLKRHRDFYFKDKKNSSDAPISIIITTLAAKAYGGVISNYYESELDLLFDVVANLHKFIMVTEIDGHKIYSIPNETTEGENFAEKWNKHPEKAVAFFQWQKEAIAYFDGLGRIANEGLDNMQYYLIGKMGKLETNRAFNKYVGSFNTHREEGNLSVIPKIGLTAATTGGLSVRRNTFFGR